MRPNYNARTNIVSEENSFEERAWGFPVLNVSKNPWIEVYEELEQDMEEAA